MFRPGALRAALGEERVWRLDGASTVVEFETDSDSGYHDFKDGTHVAIDILAPKTDAAAYASARHRQADRHQDHQSGRKQCPGASHCANRRQAGWA
jgi:hypothetical protein